MSGYVLNRFQSPQFTYVNYKFLYLILMFSYHNNDVSDNDVLGLIKRLGANKIYYYLLVYYVLVVILHVSVTY